VGQETALRQLHREAVDLVLCISNLATQAQMLEGGGPEHCRGELGNALLLRSEAFASPVLALLAGSLVWPDSIAKGKAIEAASRVLGMVGGKVGTEVAEACRAQMAGELFQAAVSGMVSSLQAPPGDRGDIEGPLAALITDLYVAMSSTGHHASSVQRALGSAAQMSPAELRELNARECQPCPQPSSILLRPRFDC